MLLNVSGTLLIYSQTSGIPWSVNPGRERNRSAVSRRFKVALAASLACKLKKQCWYFMNALSHTLVNVYFLQLISLVYLQRYVTYIRQLTSMHLSPSVYGGAQSLVVFYQTPSDIWPAPPPPERRSQNSPPSQLLQRWPVHHCLSWNEYEKYYAWCNLQ